MVGNMDLFRVFCKSEYFCKRGLTGFWVFCPSGRFVELVQEISFCLQRNGVGTLDGTRGFQGNPVPNVHFCTVPRNEFPAAASCPRAGAHNTGVNIVAGKEYLTRQATTLIKFAKVTTDPQMIAGLVDKAVDLKSKVDEAAIDRSPRAPDVQPED
jgi:hypothetical protein